MPTTPKIPKETILVAALKLLIRDGFSAVNIKSIAKELGCSTQPISWHFGNMEGLRKELGNYAYAYADQKTTPSSEDAILAFNEIGNALTDLAFDEPNLFRFLFLDGNAGYCMGGIEALTELSENKELSELIAVQNHLSSEFAAKYLESMIIYTVGILSLSVSGVLRCTKQEVKEKIDQAGSTFLNCRELNHD